MSRGLGDVYKRQLHAPNEELEGHNDHRIVMAMAVLCASLGGTIRGAEAVNKSYPDFFRTLRALGLRMDVRPAFVRALRRTPKFY